MVLRLLLPSTLLFTLAFPVCTLFAEPPQTPAPSEPRARIIGTLTDTASSPDRKGTITLQGLINDFEIDPRSVTTLSPDIFKPGRFSVFDALVHACKTRGIDIKHKYDPALKTHVIDSINGQPNWWYAAHYHGGGQVEEPVHRMDTHPYKDWMEIEVYPVSESRIAEVHAAFRAEVERLKKNAGKVVIPEVTLTTPNQKLLFTNVEVTPHNLRSDIFQPGVLTAADVMLSLADQGKLSLDCTWMENVGTALVQGYYFTRFNAEEAHGRAGFTYSLGEKAILDKPSRRFGNNFFHMTSDIRVIVSPEYVEWRWTDLSRGAGSR